MDYTTPLSPHSRCTSPNPFDLLRKGRSPSKELEKQNSSFSLKTEVIVFSQPVSNIENVFIAACRYIRSSNEVNKGQAQNLYLRLSCDDQGKFLSSIIGKIFFQVVPENSKPTN